MVFIGGPRESAKRFSGERRSNETEWMPGVRPVERSEVCDDEVGAHLCVRPWEDQGDGLPRPAEPASQ